MQNKGSMIKPASIVLAIWGIIAFVVNLKSYLYYRTIFKAAGGMTVFAVLLLIAATGVMVVAGVLGFLNSNNPSKAGLCKLVGIIALALLWVGTIMVVATYGTEAVNWIFVIIGTALSAWYILSATQLANS